VSLSRNAPDFTRPGGLLSFPLGDAFISRTPVRFEPAPRGGVRLHVPGDSTQVRVAWEPPSGALLVSGYWDGDQITLRRIGAAAPGARASEPLAWFGPVARLADFSVSRDGRLLAFSRPAPRGDIWVLDAVRGKY
jgi:hypothetical protein